MDFLYCDNYIYIKESDKEKVQPMFDKIKVDDKSIYNFPVGNVNGMIIKYITDTRFAFLEKYSKLGIGTK